METGASLAHHQRGRELSRSPSRWHSRRISIRSQITKRIEQSVGLILQSIDGFQVKRFDYCFCRPSLCPQNLVDHSSTNSGLSVPFGLSTCFSYFLPKQLNNVFFIQDFLHSPALRQVGNFDNSKIKNRLTKIYRPGQLILIILPTLPANSLIA
jgi:hypothetical protein